MLASSYQDQKIRVIQTNTWQLVLVQELECRLYILHHLVPELQG